MLIANFLSEVLIFGVAAGCVVGEAIRSNNSNNNKRQDVKDRIEELEETTKAMEIRIQSLENHMTITNKES